MNCLALEELVLRIRSLDVLVDLLLQLDVLEELIPRALSLSLIIVKVSSISQLILLSRCVVLSVVDERLSDVVLLTFSSCESGLSNEGSVSA